MIQPIILSQVAQVFMEEYGLSDEAAVDTTIKLLRKLERRGLQVIRGDWVIPEVRYYGPKADPADPNAPAAVKRDRWDELAQEATMKAHEMEAAGMAPWKPGR